MRQNNFDAALDAFEHVLIISPGSATASAKSHADRIRNESGMEI